MLGPSHPHKKCYVMTSLFKFGRMLACRTRTARNHRVKDARRSVTGPLSAASARYLRIGDSDFGSVKPRVLEMATYGFRNAPKLEF